MYRENMLSVGKIENGFIIEVRARFKREEDKDSMEVYSSTGEKELFAKDAADLGRKIEALMPMLEIEEFESEEAFEEAFEKMAK